MVFKTTLTKASDLDSSSYLLNTLRILKFHIVNWPPRELKFIVFLAYSVKGYQPLPSPCPILGSPYFLKFPIPLTLPTSYYESKLSKVEID